MHPLGFHGTCIVVLQLNTETDVERLQEAVRLLEAENRRLLQKNLALTKENLSLKGADGSTLQLRLAELEQQLALRNQQLFGRSSEKRPQPKPHPLERPRPPQRGHGPRAQPLLPQMEVVHDLDDADKTCTQCGGALGEWQGQHEESEEVDVLERRFVLKKHKRLKYRCRCGACVETAPGPTKLIPGGRYSLDFSIEVAVQKYLDHAPLERQVRIMSREGLVVDSQTLWDQLEALARVLEPGYQALHAYLLAQPSIGVDETRWPLMGKEGASRWHAWSLTASNATCYRIEDGRGAEAASRVLRDFAGVAMTDGLAVYDALARKGSFVVAHCWAHVRRKFIECEAFFPQATQAIDLIRQLYEVERLCPAGVAGDAMRAQLRKQYSRSLLWQLQTWTFQTRTLPESAFGKAITYMSGLWPGLSRFIDDPRIPLDNNATERALRGVVLGRKNHYGSRSKRGTEVAALFYSLLESAKLAGVEPKAYLRAAATAALRHERIPLPHELANPATV